MAELNRVVDEMRLAGRYLVVPFAFALIVRIVLEPGLASSAPLWLTANAALLLAVLGATRWLSLLNLDHPRWHAAVLFVLGINGGYQATGHFMQAAHGWRADDWLWAADRALLGGQDAQARMAWLNLPGVNDVLSASYLFFLILLPLVSFYYVAFARPDALARYWRGLMAVYGIGFAGYLLLPAAGPYLHHPQALVPLQHGWISGPLHDFIASQSTGVDVWPSLHCAVTLYILLWLLQAAPRLGRALLIPSALVVVSTMAMQYHYLIDVLCGTALAFAAMAVARPMEKPDDKSLVAELR